MQNYNPVEDIMSFTDKELRERAIEQDARCRLLVEHDNISLFRFSVRHNRMYFWTPSDNGKVQYYVIENYTDICPSLFFHESERFVIPMTVQEIISKRKDQGRQIFKHHDGHQISCEYTTVKDDHGNVTTIVGQMVDLYATPAKLHETIDLLNQKIAISEGLQSPFETVIGINLTDYSFTLIKATEAVSKAAAMAPDVISLARLYGQYQVMEKYQSQYYEFFNPETLAERLGGQRYISYDYETRNIGWSHARIIPVAFDNAGRPSYALLTTECTNERVAEINYLRVASEKDGLTGLCNRFKGEQVIREVLGAHRPAIFGLFDCDYFKRINDYFGHPVGDIVLKEIARTMRTLFPNDLVMRLGGDEFVVFAYSDETLQRCCMSPLSLFLPLRARISQLEIDQLHGRHLSLSCGTVVYDGSGLTPPSFDELYQKADKALYASKKNHNGTITVA